MFTLPEQQVSGHTAIEHTGPGTICHRRNDPRSTG